MARPIVARIEILAADTGVWCPRCCLPSAVTVHYVAAATHVCRVTTCHDCGARL